MQKYDSYVYEPEEDSRLLERHVRKHAKGRVLDIGTGSCVQAIAAAKNKNVSHVLATDIQKEVIDYCKKNIKNRKIRFLRSDLFENVKGTFDTIIFNPPYLPAELNQRDIRIEGGKNGYETIEKFIAQAKRFLSKDGIILTLFSSLTKKERVEEAICKSLLDSEELEMAHIFFEDIYVCLLKKNGILKRLEKNGISNLEYMSKGHRGFIFTGEHNKKKVAVKIKNPQSKAEGRIENESKWLRRLNKLKIGPQLIMAGEGYFAYKFIDGDFIADYIKKSNKRNISNAIKGTFRQLFAMDNLGVDKEEMHRPLRHIIVSKEMPFLIDFERAHFARKPKNVTQFCQFLMSRNVKEILKQKNIIIHRQEVISMAKIYKKKRDIKSFKRILKLF